MKIYATKLPEGERLELGRLLLKAGYGVRLSREKSGSTYRHYLEAEPCARETAVEKKEPPLAMEAPEAANKEG